MGWLRLGWLKIPILRKRLHKGNLVFRAPHQGLESNFCCWTAGQGPAEKDCFFSQTPVSHCCIDKSYEPSTFVNNVATDDGPCHDKQNDT